LILAIGLSSCGDNTKPPTPTSIQLNPTSASLTFGAVQPFSATVFDANNNVIQSATVTFSSNDPTVTLTTAVESTGTWFTTGCAGTWNSSQLICQPATTSKAVQVTATSGALSASTTIYIHPKVDRIVVSPTSVNCESQGHTHPFSATVFSGTQDVTSSIGPVTWGTPSGQSVATVGADGIVTAGQPGKTTIFASVSGVVSLPSSFITCPVQSIRVHLQDSADTSFTIASAGTQQLAADVADTNGQPVSNAALTWATSEPNANTVASGLVTGGVGFSSITAACLPPGCNRALNPAYSNVVLAQSTGTINATVYAASTHAASLVPIDVATGTVGTAITLPANPNSLVISPKGDFLYLGSDQGLLTVDINSATVANNTAHPGKVLAASQDGRVLVASATEVDLISSTTTEALAITGATAAAFSVQNRAYILAGSKLYIHTPGDLPPNTVPTPLDLSAGGFGSGVATDFLATGALGFVAGNGATPQIAAIANCNQTLLQQPVPITGTATFIQPLPDGSGVLAVSPTAIDRISVSPVPPQPISGCPASANLATPDSNPFVSTLVPRQLIVLPDGSKAYVTSDQGQLQVYDITHDSMSTISLNGGASAYTGGALLDASKVYVGGSDSKIHVIDVANAKDDAQQISVGFVPDLVAIK
jgi:hypothetical protein